MTSISSSSAVDQTQLLAQLKQQALTALSAGLTSDSSTASTNATSALNALYGSDGTNTADTQTKALASSLGMDSDALNQLLQSGNKQDVSKILSDQMQLTGLKSSGNLFDSSL